MCHCACASSYEVNLFFSLPILLYLVDTFIYAASATAAASVSILFFVVVDWVTNLI